MERTRDPGEPNERRWLEAVAGGDRVAFESLYARYERPLYRYLCGLVRSHETAEEVLVDVMVEVWRSARSYAGASRPSTWIFSIAHHKATDRLRRRNLERATLDELGAVSDPRDLPEEAALRESFVREVALALAELSAEHREVIELAFGCGYSYREIAEIAGVPLGTVKTRMHFARKQLQLILERRGVQREMR